MLTSLLYIFGLIALAVNASPTIKGNLEKRGTRTTNPGGCLEVQGTNPTSSQHKTLSLAITALGSGTTTQCIFIWPGTYTEQVVIQYKGALTLYGYSTNIDNYKDNEVTFTFGATSTTAGSDDASATIHLLGNNYTLFNLDIVNSHGAGTQAIALTATGNFLGFYGLSITGYQDTLYAKSGIQYYSKTYIQGADDFIFGGAAAWFGLCTIACSGGGAITANSRMSSTDPAWYVFDTSTITSTPSWTTTQANYLGRPWFVDARVTYQRSTLSAVINPIGWDQLAANPTPQFEEFDNTGPGSSTTARVMETKATALVTYEQLWGTSGWQNVEF